MPQHSHTLTDFSAVIFGHLPKPQTRFLTLDLITMIVDVLFWSSLQTEELRPMNCALLLADPHNVDSEPPPSIRDNRWKYVPFAEPIDLSRHNLVKLAVAADAKSALLVTYPGDDKIPMLWGLVDQQLAWARFAKHEGDEGRYALPKAMILHVLGVGHIAASYDDNTIAEFASGRMIQEVPDVLLEHCAISRTLKTGFTDLLAVAYRSLVQEKTYKRHCSEELFSLWVDTYKRILCRIREARHGGTVLVADKRHLRYSTIQQKFRIDYDRISIGLIHQAVHQFFEFQARFMIEDYIHEHKSEAIPTALYLSEVIHTSDKDDAIASIEGAIQLACSLAMYDGALLMSPDLHVRAFGVEVLSNQTPPEVVYAARSNTGRISYKKADIQKFGTRHRSAARFCWANPGAVAFVVSQDGGVRAMTRQGARVIFWEDIKIVGL